jgi:hypothetical protein
MIEGDFDGWMILADTVEYVVEVGVRNDDEEMLFFDPSSHGWH